MPVGRLRGVLRLQPGAELAYRGLGGEGVEPPAEVLQVLGAAVRAQPRQQGDGLGTGAAGLLDLALLHLCAREQQHVDRPAPGAGGGVRGERLLRAPGGLRGLAQVAVAVGQFVGEVGVVEVRDPRRVLVGLRALHGADGEPGDGGEGARVAQQGVAARLGRVEHRLRGVADLAPGSFLRRTGELGDLPGVAEGGGQMAHARGQDVAAVSAVAGGLGEPERLDVVALRQARLAGVHRHVPRQLGQPGDGGEQLATHRLPVAARQQARHHAVEVVHHHRPDMAAAEPVVQLRERLGGGLDRLDVGSAHPGTAVARHALVRAGDQPVPAGLDKGGGRDRGAGQEVAPSDVAPPQLADLLDRAQHGRREVQADAGGQVLAVGHADLVYRHRAAELAPQGLGDDAGRPAARLLAAQPAGHRRLVVAQVEAVLRPAHVDPAGEPGVGAAGLLDQRLEPLVRLPRHKRSCGHGVPLVLVNPVLVTDVCTALRLYGSVSVRFRVPAAPRRRDSTAVRPAAVRRREGRPYGCAAARLPVRMLPTLRA
ncbi:hypothetical protein SCOCK_780018 [Actinacidiphila cocklensis]|uniref:Uncharacterized protein n=1 Tax=Actinacidiphila cocklensis TaxID=887465 RepID=A0A9W4E0Q0_9ACTN|nr:hypothetical protein SCOCK_780018 [Actinacidiphila cocklensis]